MDNLIDNNFELQGDSKLFQLNSDFNRILKSKDIKCQPELLTGWRDLAETDEEIKRGMKDLIFKEMQLAFKRKDDERVARIWQLRGLIFDQKKPTEDKQLTDQIEQVIDEGEFDYAVKLSELVEMTGELEIADDLRDEMVNDWQSQPSEIVPVTEEPEFIWKDEDLVPLIIRTDDSHIRQRAVEVLYRVINQPKKYRNTRLSVTVSYNVDKLLELLNKMAVKEDKPLHQIIANLYLKLDLTEKIENQKDKDILTVRKKILTRQLFKRLTDQMGRRYQRMSERLNGDLAEYMKQLVLSQNDVAIINKAGKISITRQKLKTLKEDYERALLDQDRYLIATYQQMERADDLSEKKLADDLERISQEINRLEEQYHQNNGGKEARVLAVRRTLHNLINFHGNNIGGINVIDKMVKKFNAEKRNFMMPLYLLVQSKYGFGIRREQIGLKPQKYDEEMDELFDVLEADEQAKILGSFFQETAVRDFVVRNYQEKTDFLEEIEWNKVSSEIRHRQKYQNYSAERVKYLFEQVQDGNPGELAHDKAVAVFHHLLQIESDGEVRGLHRPSSYLLIGYLLSVIWPTVDNQSVGEANEVLRQITGNNLLKVEVGNCPGEWILHDYPVRGDKMVIKGIEKHGDKVNQGLLTWIEEQRVQKNRMRIE